MIIIEPEFLIIKSIWEKKNTNIINKITIGSECVESVPSAHNIGAVIDENLCHHKLAMYARTLMLAFIKSAKLGIY